MNTKIKLAGVILGAALTTTSAFAGNTSCGAGKCGANMKKMENKDKKGSCGDDMKKMGKKDKKGSCSDDMKKKMKKKMKKGSCGAGKCGANMKTKEAN